MSRVLPFSHAHQSIAVLGGGAIGSTFAYYLARAGHEISVVARPASPRLGQLQREQAIVLKSGERAEIDIADALDEEAAYDLIIVTTLAHQVDALLPSLKRSRARCVLFMFNTFEPERLQTAIGESRCAFGMPFVMSKLDDGGRLDATVTSRRKTLLGDSRWVSLFTSAGIPAEHEAKMPLWLRCHVPLCIAMESIAVKARQRGSSASWAEAMVVARGLHGGFKIVKELGYPLFPATKKVLNGTPDFLIACMLCLISRSRSFRELLSTGLNECRSLVDSLILAASASAAISPATLKSVRDMEPAA